MAGDPPVQDGIQDHRGNVCNDTGDPPSSVVLQIPAERPSQGSGERGPVLRGPLPPIPALQQGTGMVDNPLRERWNGKSIVVDQPDFVIESDASLKGWGAAHGEIKTGGSWSKEEKQYHINCLEIMAAHLAITTFLKDHANVIHQPPGRDSVAPGNRGHKKLVDVVLREKHLSKSPAPPRCGQCQSRPGVQGDERQVRLDAEPLSLSKDPAQAGPGVSRPVRIPPDHTVGGLFQLETRSTSTGNRCNDARLDRVEGVCQPPVGLDRQRSCQCSEGACPEDSSGGSSLAHSSVVPHSTRPVVDYPWLIPP